MMDWTSVIDFIRARDPAFLSTIEGVPEEAVAGLAGPVGERALPLPRAYVTFLRLMGADSDGYAPFGVTQAHDLATIAERLDEEDEPPSARFFPVALETDDSLEALYDHFLDLQRCDGNDAALVLLEQGVPFEWQKPVDLFETFGERITASVFNHFACRHRAERDVVAVGGASNAREGRGALQKAVALLQELGFTPTLPPLPRVACMSRDPLDVLAHAHEDYELLTLRISGDNRVAVLELADQLLTSLPGARRPAGPRNLD